MTSDAISIRRLLEPSAQERDRIVQILLAAFQGDMEIAAMTGGRSSLEPAFFRAQLELCLTQGELYVGGAGGGMDGVLFVYGPGQDFLADPNTNWPPSREYVSKLTPEMQQWWNTHLRPKFSELTVLALGSHEVRKAAWYVRTMAVHPEKQRRGVGRRLMESVLHKADAGRQRACLEAHTNTLVTIFSKFGFKPKGTKNFGSYQGGFPLFCMLREPRA